MRVVYLVCVALCLLCGCGDDGDSGSSSGGGGGGSSVVAPSYQRACTDGSQCAGGLCLPLPDNREGLSGLCSAPCLDDGFCDAGGVCVADANGDGVCLARCTGDAQCSDPLTCVDDVLSNVQACFTTSL